MEGNWSIVLGERALNAPALVKRFLGLHDSHSFVQIRDGNQKPLIELHGLYTSGWGAAFNTIAKSIFGRPIHTSRLRVLALTGDKLMHVFTGHKPVTPLEEFHGSREEVLRRLDAMLRASARINQGRLDYFLNLRHPEDAQSCHSVSTELFRVDGADVTKEKIPFTTPGRQIDLEKLDPELRMIRVDRQAPLEGIKTFIAEEAAGFSPDLHGVPIWLQPDTPILGAQPPSPHAAGMR